MTSIFFISCHNAQLVILENGSLVFDKNVLYCLPLLTVCSLPISPCIYLMDILKLSCEVHEVMFALLMYQPSFYGLGTGAGTFSYKGPDPKYFRLCEPDGFCHNCLTLLLYHESSLR